MNIRQYFMVFVSLTMTLYFPVFGYCYWEKVHQRITLNAIDKSSLNDSLIKSGFLNGVDEKTKDNKSIEKKTREWIQDGSASEDEFFSSLVTARYLNHFYDPLNGLGLVDLPYFGTSSFLWASTDWHNAWRWEMARTYFYDGLTKTTKTDRDAALSKAFRAIGQVMHLVQDLAVPAHVRNDAHPTGDPYELWTRGNVANLDYSMVPFPYWNVSISPSAPKQFWDLDSYDGTTPYDSGYIGLAEYTNANFFSSDTIFKKYSHPAYADTSYPNIDWQHPEIIDAEDGKLDSRIYIKRTVNGSNDRLASVSYISYDCIKKGYHQYSPIVLDDTVHKDYASHLLPRAIGYSTGLLNYFFRGKIEITLPDNGVYAIMAPNGSFQEIRIKAKNMTTTEEDMTNGEIKLVVKYKLAQADPFQSVPVDVSPDFYYAVGSAKNNANAIPKENPTELAFDFSASPIPLWATDVYLQVVYKGKLGNEEGAVAVGFKDISEPTPIDIMNSMDHICINGNYMVAGSPEAINAVDSTESGGNNNGIADEWDVFAHGLSSNYVAFSPVTNPRTASAAIYNALFADIPPAQYGRVYILTDYELDLSNATTIYNTDSRDTWITWTDTVLYVAKGLKNQTDTINGEQIRTYPLMPSERGVRWWWAIDYVNEEYPLGSQCTTSDAQPNFTGPIAVTIP